MTRVYKDRAMASEPVLQEFFYPKNVPPVTIKAVTREEAEAKLAAFNKKDHD